MKRRPVCLDLFAGAGGAARGLIEAGFDVLGVDIKPQPRYPGPALVADVMNLELGFVRQFDAVWASPPCQGYTAMRHAPGAKGDAPKLIEPVIDFLRVCALPWAVENIETEEVRAAMGGEGVICLCGSMFGLGAKLPGGGWARLQRHRLFVASFPLQVPKPCEHKPGPVLGVYGAHARIRSAAHGGRTTAERWEGGGQALAARAMGMPASSTLADMSEAIPPAYTRWLGAQLMAEVKMRARG